MRGYTYLRCNKTIINTALSEKCNNWVCSLAVSKGVRSELYNLIMTIYLRDTKGHRQTESNGGRRLRFEHFESVFNVDNLMRWSG